MFFTVYKITNLINQKYYIGMHKTNDLNDGYMGSGKLITSAIQKYGIENFTKEYLFIGNNEIDMKNKEKELVVLSEQSYNLCPGGHGGFGYINSNNLKKPLTEQAKQMISEKILDLWESGHYEEVRAKLRATASKEHRKSNFFNSPEIRNRAQLNAQSTKSRKKRIETLKSINHQQGTSNSQFGTCWVYSSDQSKKINESELSKYLDLGWKKGRKMFKSKY